MSNDMALNVFFFSDESMRQLYVNYGKYDFVQQIPKILYSTIISKLLEIFLCYLSLTDKHMYQIKNLIIKKSIRNNISKIYECIKIKLVVFFIFTFIILLLYWYIVSAFCAVYPNTQTPFVKDCILSFLLGNVLPFGIYLIPSILRICALRNPKSGASSYCYKLSDIIPIF